ncbi:unnamed protein product [Periconia digitata]|uniref:Glutamine amidotransferase domain-containing protein n=1 Tax=Periconia digitata TaxID=1303443 RepID=A0A9W4U8X9_9PLEO|nr:unnamed protein product [Periconia digitata]
MTTKRIFKAAVLVNSISSLDPAFKNAFQENITTASRDAQVDFFDPIKTQIYPEIGEYDLIVLTGGNVADAAAKDIPWLLKMQEFLRATVDKSPMQKIVGVCWGHQLTHITFGGTVGSMNEFEVGVTPVTLTHEGSAFYSGSFPSNDELRIHQFHEREVKVPGKGFVALAENNQCLVNAANTILTFQGHPEMSAELSKLLLEDTPKYKGQSEEEIEVLDSKINRPHDGIAVWARIIQWAGEA